MVLGQSDHLSRSLLIIDDRWKIHFTNGLAGLLVWGVFTFFSHCHISFSLTFMTDFFWSFELKIIFEIFICYFHFSYFFHFFIFHFYLFLLLFFSLFIFHVQFLFLIFYFSFFTSDFFHNSFSFILFYYFLFFIFFCTSNI